MERLLTLYLPALRAHLTETKRIDPQVADDLLQDFVAVKFLEENLPSQANRSRGRFRTLVLTALDHFLVDERRRSRAAKRGATCRTILDHEQLAARPAPEVQPADGFDVMWARQVLSETIRRMQAACLSSNRPDVWGVFEYRVLGPTLDNAPPPAYTDLVQRFGFRSPSQASNVLITAKRMFERILRAVVSEYSGASAEVEEELRDLRAVLARGRAGCDGTLRINR